MAEKKKKYGNMRIMSLDGSNIWRHMHGVNGFPPLSALNKDGKLNIKMFDGILDESLDTAKLAEVYAKHQAEMGYSYMADKLYCRALVTVSFKYTVKEYEKLGRRYVKYGYTVTDEDMHDHICIRDGILAAIEVPYNKDTEYLPVEAPADNAMLGKCFVYDAKRRVYDKKGDIPPAVKTVDLREQLYADGFDIDGIHYVRYKRSAGASRDGRCLFIAEPLYADMMEWSSCGLCADSVSDQASWQAYISLTLSSIENAIQLPKKALLIIPDKVSKFKTTAVCVKEDATEGLVAVEEETEIENVIWDGEALMDVSVFENNGYGDKAMMPFGDWIDFWYENFCKPAIRDTTKESYENRIYDHIIPEIGKIPLNRLGHVSAETTLNIYSHITDTMRQQAAVKIDREIGGCDTQMPTEDGMRTDANATAEIATEEEFEPYRGKIRKPGTGCISKINDHLYEGRFTPTINGKRVSKNIYAKTREECEEKLAELIKVTKAEIAEMKANASA